jgi:hypothetical protein
MSRSLPKHRGVHLRANEGHAVGGNAESAAMFKQHFWMWRFIFSDSEI